MFDDLGSADESVLPMVFLRIITVQCTEVSGASFLNYIFYCTPRPLDIEFDMTFCLYETLPNV